MTADEYHELIEKYVARARADQSIAERLAEEARQHYGAAIEVPPETE
jgi:threonine aldolase